VLSLAIIVCLLSFSILPAQSQDFIITDLSDPVLKDISRHDTIGTAKFITTTIVNGEDFEKPFVIIIEARDTTGVTTYLQFQIGILSARGISGISDVGVSWLPEKPGKYELRAFAISNFTNPQILTDVRTGEGIIA